MRFISVTDLEVGMICGKNLYDVTHQLLIKKGGVVHKSYRDRIVRLGYQGIYIDDDLSKDLTIEDIISDQLRIDCIKVIKDLFLYVQNPKKPKGDFNSRIDKIEKLVEDLVSQIHSKERTIINLVDLKFYEDYTYFHSVNVAVLAILVGMEYGLKRQDVVHIGMASFLQDIGEMFIDPHILTKEGRLTDEEFKAVKKHPILGHKYLKASYKIHATVYTAVLHHHEKYDGTGYPIGLKGEKISILAQIISMAEIYDALTTKRPFRNPLLPSEAMEYIMANSGVLFNLELARIFSRKIAPFPVGTYITLSNGIKGIVVTNYVNACMRPKIRVLVDEKGEAVTPYIIDLRDDKVCRALTIVGVNDIEMQSL